MRKGGEETGIQRTEETPFEKETINLSVTRMHVNLIKLSDNSTRDVYRKTWKNSANPFKPINHNTITNKSKMKV